MSCDAKNELHKINKIRMIHHLAERRAARIASRAQCAHPNLNIGSFKGGFVIFHSFSGPVGDIYVVGKSVKMGQDRSLIESAGAM